MSDCFADWLWSFWLGDAAGDVFVVQAPRASAPPTAAIPNPGKVFNLFMVCNKRGSG